MDSKVDSSRAIQILVTGWLNGIAAAAKKHLKILGTIVFLADQRK